MNRPIVRLYGLVVILFLALIAFTSRWTVFEASSLRSNPLNVRKLLEAEHIERGAILAANGAVLAHSRRGTGGTFQRSYPFGEEFAAAIGYAYTDLSEAGLELYRDNVLTAKNTSNFQSVLDQLQGKRPRGDRVITTLDPTAQRVAIKALGEHSGAVVAIEPHSGAVQVMASVPSYNPNRLRSVHEYEKLAHDSAHSPLVNRATQYGYAPGSTFKVVTATAAIDSGLYTPSSTVDGRNDVLVSGVPLQNDENRSYGQITLTQALVHSVNTVYAQVAERVGKRTLARYMDRFGFDRKPQLDYPSDEMSSSGEYLLHNDESRLLQPTSELVDVGRMGIGQDKLQVTPLQMAEVAAAVANNGRLMVPHLTSRIVEPEGGTVERYSPRVQSTVMKPSTAAAVRGMMEAVVNEGTGTTAQIPGVQVAGKTGTAETEIGQPTNNVWFIAFAPASDPRVAIAVTLKGVPGQGASFAAPVAKQVMEALLHD
jgi:peptidoglycan glycosyltransferase